MPDSLQALHVGSGKVREIYRFGDELLLVASDRISAFDVIMPTPIPDKGRVLTGLSLFWFERTSDLVRNHLLTARPSEMPDVARQEPHIEGRTMLVRRLTMFPIECVVRGYMAGSAWKEYQAGGTVCGHALPPGLRESDKLPEPIFTPATKAESGHDINIDLATAGMLIGRDRVAELQQLSISVYQQAADYAVERGIIIADTKFEFGLDEAEPCRARRRGADARLVAVLAGRRATSRGGRSPRSTSSTCATGWRRSTGTSRRPGPSCPTRSPQARARATWRPTSS